MAKGEGIAEDEMVSIKDAINMNLDKRQERVVNCHSMVHGVMKS